MLLDWFTVVAQIVNFAILVYLLKRFLYRPILKAMDERRDRIRSQWEKAQQERDAAENEAATYREKQRHLDDRRRRTLAEVQKEADLQRQELLQQAREEVDRSRYKWHESLRRERRYFIDRLRQQTAQQTYTMARRVLQDIADTSLEERTVKLFFDRLDNLDNSERQQLVESMQRSPVPVAIRSSFELPADDGQKILDRLQAWVPNIELVREQDMEELSTEEEEERRILEVNFSIAPETICGVEIRANGYELAWSFDSYLQELEARIESILERELRKRSQASIAEETPEERVQRQLLRQTYDLTRRALQDIASSDLERQAIDTFVRRWQQLSHVEKERIEASIRASDEPLRVLSSFDLSDDDRDRIAKALPSDRIEFVRSPRLVCGIEVQLRDREIAWSLDSYLNSLDEQVSLRSN